MEAGLGNVKNGVSSVAKFLFRKLEGIYSTMAVNIQEPLLEKGTKCIGSQRAALQLTLEL